MITGETGHAHVLELQFFYFRFDALIYAVVGKLHMAIIASILLF